MLTERSEIHGDEWFLFAGTILMDGLGYQFLTRAVAATDQDASIRGSDSFQSVNDFLDFTTGVNNSLEPKLFVQSLMQLIIRSPQQYRVRRLLSRCPNVVLSDRFFNKSERA